MNIGFVTTWAERGATYVSRSYIDALKDSHQIFVYARGGHTVLKHEDKSIRITKGYRMYGTHISKKHFFRWLKKEKIDLLFFNEQREFSIVALTKLNFPHIVLGAYLDYYQEETIKFFKVYDFLIANTLRHYSAFKDYNCHYVKWGVNLSAYPYLKKSNKEIIFFHSAGLSNRKGTLELIDVFKEYELGLKAKLIVHLQDKNPLISSIDSIRLSEKNIDIIIKDVAPPGLYSIGDVYVYPTSLDGLGLTIYEALSSGLPIIVPDFPPMNEIVDSHNGRLIKVQDKFCRNDAYYWPKISISKESLSENLLFYISNSKDIEIFKKKARHFAEKELNILDRFDRIRHIFEKSKVFDNTEIANEIIKQEKQNRKRMLLKTLLVLLPPFSQGVIINRLD